MPRYPIRAAWPVFLCLLAACVSWPMHTPSTTSSAATASPADVDQQAVDALYAEAEDALAQGEQALAAWRQGANGDSAQQLAQSRARLIAAARRCAHAAGCAIERVLRAQDVLLDQQAQALFEKAGRVAGADPAAAAILTQGSPVLAAMPESGRSLNLLNGRQLRELIEFNAPLRAALREWLTWMRPQLLDAYENYQYMRYKMWPAYADAGLPEALLFGILAKESGGKVHAVSTSGASGPLQFMPATGLRYGLRVEAGFDTRFDPAASTQANVAYLNDQFGRLNNDLELVLGAYNGGEGRMSRLSPQGSRRFWDPRVFKQLPPETRAYVPMVLAAAWLFLHPEEYGLRFPHVEDSPGQITLAAPMSINELSMCLGQDGNDRGWFRTLRNLNPRWDPNVRLTVGTQVDAPARAAAAYARQCTKAEVLARMQSLQDARIPGVDSSTRLSGAASQRTHVVSRGETLSTIARKHGCNTIKGIASANRIAAPRYAIREGQKLRVPDCRA